jgi:dihydroneopterin aldolase
MKSVSMESIFITDLTLKMHIGVTEKERQKKQKIRVSVEMEPDEQGELNDSISNTVDYSAVRRGIESLLTGSSIKLIETVAARTARYVLGHYRIREVCVTVKKRPYRDVTHVGCRLRLSKEDSNTSPQR